MATYVLPAIRAHIGCTTYYTVTMTAQELASMARPANELSEWTQWTISERIQRNVTVARVRDELIPYLLESQDRFFGSLIIVAYETETFEFEPLATTGVQIRGAYTDAAGRMGFLTITGGRMVALDGQHRLVGLREIVNGRCKADADRIADIARDEVCVVFIEFESLEKTRRIFNKVNRHARPVAPHDNIITSEDDGYAIVARWLVEEEPPLGLSDPVPPLALFTAQGEPLVEWQSTTIAQNSPKLTTLNAVYQSVEAICDAHGLKHFDEKHRINRPTNAELERAYTWCADWWTLVLEGLAPYVRAVRNPSLMPDLRQFRARSSLLFRPVAQVAVFRAIGQCRDLGMRPQSAVDRMNKIRWSASAKLWEDVIIRSNGRMIATKDAIRLTARLITYLVAADRMSDGAIDTLRSNYNFVRGGRSAQLPSPVR